MEPFNEVLVKNPLVIDNGSGVIKAGFAGDELPNLCFNNQVGRPKHLKVIPTKSDAEFYVGNSTDQFRGLLKLKHPMSHGVVTSWSDMELVWKHLYSEMKVWSKEHPVLLTEAPLNPFPAKAKMAQIFFESLNVPALFVAVQSILSLYANGKTTGVMLDSGDGVTHCLPVFEGFSIPHAAGRIDLAGRDITEYLGTLTRKAGYTLSTSAEFEILRTMKEKVCMVSQQPILEGKELEMAKDKDAKEGLKDRDREKEKNAEKKNTIPYILPDGSQIDLGSERLKAPEILFNPSLVGLECPSINELLVNCVSKADIDLRKTLYSEIYLGGGTTMLQMFPERLLTEVKKSVAKDIKIKIHAPSERQFSCWAGGSILSALGSFKKMWISKKEFEEYGDKILAMKSF